MRICVVGTGYVGLVAGAGFADVGNDVVCCDVDAKKVTRLRRRQLPIYEPGLDELVAHNMAEGRLGFTSDIGRAVCDAEIVILAVGTPPLPEGAADLRQIFEAAASVAAAVTGPTIVVVKSTVPVGTGDKLEEFFSRRSRHPVVVASNPEFLKEGGAVDDFLHPDRIVVGCTDRGALSRLRVLYAPFLRLKERIIVMDRRSAEITKYAANAMLAARISFMNDLANLCDAIGADIDLVRKGVGGDARIGDKFLSAGVGFGGSCFPKDLRAALTTAREAGVSLEILTAVLAVNERQKHLLGTKIVQHFGGDLSGRRIAIWGLAFKPGTDDLREAPALVLIEDLLAAGASVVATDPQALGAARAILDSRVELVPHSYTAAEGADALALVTEWDEYRAPNFSRLKRLMRTPVLFDGRNQWDPDPLRAAGFTYVGIGRGRATVGRPDLIPFKRSGLSPLRLISSLH
jgi:UDPglucose 6-dehydrogenase